MAERTPDICISCGGDHLPEMGPCSAPVRVIQPTRDRLLDALEELAPVVVDTPPSELQGFKGLGLILSQLELERPGSLARARGRTDQSPEAVARRRRERMEHPHG